MKWKTKIKYKAYQMRVRKKFLWLPLQCKDGITRWLEFYEVTEQLQITRYTHPNGYDQIIGMDPYRWEIINENP